MSNALAIASVSAVLKNLLTNGLIDRDPVVSLGDFSVTGETEIVFQHMPAAGDHRAVILRISAAQIEIRTVLVGGIVGPLEAARVMIGVEPVHFVSHRDATDHHVTGDRIR